MSPRRRHAGAWALGLAVCAGAVSARVLAGPASPAAKLAAAPAHATSAPPRVTTVTRTRTVVVTERHAASAPRAPRTHTPTRRAAAPAPAPAAPSGPAVRTTPARPQRAAATPKRRTPAAKHRTPAAPSTQNVDGDVIATRYGPVQVRAVMQGSRLLDVVVLQDPHDLDRSRQIDADALPRLRAQAIDAQGASIDGVAGATYTSHGYRQSLQSALDLA